MDMKTKHVNAMRSLLFILTLIVLMTTSCETKKSEANQPKYVGEIKIINERLNEIISADAKLEVIADGHDWSEGPLWLPNEKKLIWSDVPRNTIYQWSESDGVSVYLTPSGYTSTISRGGETGSNGLLLDGQGRLVLCQHGDRRVARMESALSTPAANFVSLAEAFDGKKFNSPNDAAFGPNGNLYFTDPPYGLERQMEDSLKEISFQGVYKVTPEGQVTVMTQSLTRPNGIAFNKDKTKCYVANSDPDHAVWMIYDVDEQGDLIHERLFFDATSMVEPSNGLPDGLKINQQDILFATGPGGLFIFTPEGQHLGTLHTGSPISNCALNEDESVLYMTSDAMIVRVNLGDSKASSD